MSNKQENGKMKSESKHGNVEYKALNVLSQEIATGAIWAVRVTERDGAYGSLEFLAPICEYDWHKYNERARETASIPEQSLYFNDAALQTGGVEIPLKSGEAHPLAEPPKTVEPKAIPVFTNEGFHVMCSLLKRLHDAGIDTNQLLTAEARIAIRQHINKNYIR